MTREEDFRRTSRAIQENKKQLYNRSYYETREYKQLVSPDADIISLPRREVQRIKIKLLARGYPLQCGEPLLYLIGGGAGITENGAVHLFHQTRRGIAGIEKLLDILPFRSR